MKKLLLFSAVCALSAIASQAEELPYQLQMPASTQVWHNTSFYREDVGQIGMGYISLRINAGDVTVNRESSAVVKFYYNDELLNTLPASDDTKINMSGVVGGLDNDDDYVPPTSQEVSFYIAPDPDENYFRNGTYKLVIEDGVFHHGTEEDGWTDYEGATITYNYTNEDKVDFSYYFTPSTSDMTSNLKTFVLTFPNAKTVTYRGMKVYDTLLFPNGTKVKTAQSYPKTEGNTITFYYTDPANGKWANEWVDGEYTFTIPAYSWDKSSDDGKGIVVDNVEFPGLEVKFKVGAPKLEWELVFPAADEVYRNHTVLNEDHGVLGMSAVMIDLIGGNVNIDRTSEGKVTLYYNDEVLVALDASNEEAINMTGVAGADDDEYVPPTRQQVTFRFGDPGEQFEKDGTYKIVIDNGVFKRGTDALGWESLSGGELVYTYTNVDKADWNYVLTPADGSIVENLKEITIEFPNAEKVWWNGMKAYDTLKHEDGTEMRRASSYPKNLANNKVAFYYNDPANGKWANDWKDGLYTFTIPAAGYDSAKDDNVGITVDNTDFPGLTAFYKIGGNNTDIETSVEAIGLTPAASYTVVALDGKVIAKDAPATALFSINAGMYIINGKKVIIRK